MTDTLTDAVEAGAGRSLDALDIAEALDVAEQLRAIVAALPADNAHDRHLAARLIDAAELVECRAGIA